MLLVLVAWVSLSAGTMWLNAALDGDEGGALFAERVARPDHLRLHGAAALALAVVLAWLGDRGAGAACAACAGLAVLYSHPRTAWKGHPVLGPAVNAIGYGALSSLAGWSVADVTMDLRTAAAFLFLTVFIVGATFAAQAFQGDDDARRGYRTLVVTHGPAACLRVAHACLAASLAGVSLLAIAGYYPRLCLLGLPAFVPAHRWVRRWQRRPDGGEPADAAGLVLRVLLGACVLISLAFVDYLGDALEGRPAAGRATARGRPTRPPRPTEPQGF
jgi:4-hydroxybenzoate polyprenyltransferase